MTRFVGRRGLLDARVVIVARCSYIVLMASTGIRELKDHLSHYVRRIETGERIAVTAHGRVVAELCPPARPGQFQTRYEALVAAGDVRPPLEAGDPFADWPKLRLPPGTAALLIEEDRGKP